MGSTVGSVKGLLSLCDNVAVVCAVYKKISKSPNPDLTPVHPLTYLCRV